MQIILLFVNYTSTKLSTWFWQTFWIFFFNISQLQELSGMFLISQSLRIPQPHSLFRQVGIYSSVFYFFFLPVMVGIVGIGHYGLLCCEFTYSSYHVLKSPDWWARNTYVNSRADLLLCYFDIECSRFGEFLMFLTSLFSWCAEANLSV